MIAVPAGLRVLIATKPVDFAGGRMAGGAGARDAR